MAQMQLGPYCAQAQAAEARAEEAEATLQNVTAENKAGPHPETL